MTQGEALNILKTGANVFLTGEPGAGKTYTINAYVDYLRSCDIEPAITASTGIAATHIGGMTIHSWSGIGIKNRLDKYDLDKIATSEYLAKRIGRTKVLIIDEISMLSANMLNMIDMVCREIRQSGAPFGGMQIILVGDFFQLPPIMRRDDSLQVQKQSMFEDEREEPETPFAYSSGAWERAQPIICYLAEQHRQDDDEFLSVLGAIRADNFDEQHFDYINKRHIDRDEIPQNITKLYTHNVDVDRVNNIELAKLAQETKVFTMSSSGKENIITTLKKGCLSPESLELKVGAIVMCTKNNPKEGYVNGTLGTVIGFDEFMHHPIIKTKNGKTITMIPMDWSVEENGKVRAQISQVPLRLAWAITVHKSQGMSLDSAIMDLSQVFEFGQGYVALSRVRRLSGLYLLGINAQALKVHPNILEKDIEFKNRSEEAVQVFGKLSSAEIKKMHENFITTSGGKLKKQTKKEASKNTANTFEKIREKHPNAFRPWKAEQDEELKKLYSEGMSTSDLMKQFGRKRGAITARLEKLGLIDASYKKSTN